MIYLLPRKHVYFSIHWSGNLSLLSEAITESGRICSFELLGSCVKEIFQNYLNFHFNEMDLSLRYIIQNKDITEPFKKQVNLFLYIINKQFK